MSLLTNTELHVFSERAGSAHEDIIRKISKSESPKTDPKQTKQSSRRKISEGEPSAKCGPKLNKKSSTRLCAAIKRKGIGKGKKQQAKKNSQQLETKTIKINYISKETIIREVLFRKRSKPIFRLSENPLKIFEERTKAVCSHIPDDNDTSDLNCPICFELLIAATATVCGHTFCEKCLMESLIVNPGCPICRTPLRSYQNLYVKTIDKCVERQVNFLQDEKIKQSFRKRKADWEKWQNERTLINLKEGSRLDVRDTEYIWCVGILKKKFEKKDMTVFLIHYEGWNKVYDEFIPLNSQRLAPLGTFTDRTDIPKYTVTNELGTESSGAMYSSVVSGIRSYNLNSNEILDIDLDIRSLGAENQMFAANNEEFHPENLIQTAAVSLINMPSLNFTNGESTRAEESESPENEFVSFWRNFHSIFSRFLNDTSPPEQHNGMEEML